MLRMIIIAYYRVNRWHLAKQRAAYLADARNAAEWLWERSVTAKAAGLTIDDVRRVVGDPPIGVDPRINGSVFTRAAGWKAMRYTNSCRTVCHKRPVARFYKLA